MEILKGKKGQVERGKEYKQDKEKLVSISNSSTAAQLPREAPHGSWTLTEAAGVRFLFWHLLAEVLSTNDLISLDLKDSHLSGSG